jgi:hypothetical protein
MKKMLAVLCLGFALAFTGCATTQTSGTTDVTQTVTTTLTTVGHALAAIPATADNLYSAQLITKDQYNAIAGMYMQAKAAYGVAVDAQEMNLVVQSADSKTKFDVAFANLTKIVADVQSMIITFKGGK